MKISIVCSNENHPVMPHLRAWVEKHLATHDIELVFSLSALTGGDLLLLASCSEIIREEHQKAYRVCLVLHASDLPQGRGWSPHVWQVISGAREITVTLLEAASPVDTGRIWHKMRFPVSADMLWDEINKQLFETELALMDLALAQFDTIAPIEQDRTFPVTQFPRRTPEDSRIDPHRSIAEQFDLLRVCDPHRFPAFFELHGCKYTITIAKN